MFQEKYARYFPDRLVIVRPIREDNFWAGVAVGAVIVGIFAAAIMGY